MSTFGNIKTSIENAAIELTKTPNFKRFIFEFNSLVLKNKDLCELYYIYDDLSTNKGIPSDIANDYINESIEYSQILMESQFENIDNLNIWINSWGKTKENRYSDIDNAIYNTGIRNLESILESKKNIKSVLIKENNTVNENVNTINVPLSSVYNIANKTVSKYLENVNESDKNILKSILSLTTDELKTEMNTLKESVISKLKVTLNESKDDTYTSKIQTTINKVMESKNDHYNLYKLRTLNEGL